MCKMHQDLDQDPRFIESLSSLSQICVLSQIHRYLSHCIFFANCRSEVPVGRVKTAANTTVGWADVYIDTIWHHIEILHFKTSMGHGNAPKCTANAVVSLDSQSHGPSRCVLTCFLYFLVTRLPSRLPVRP